jgi:hypothetical protein
VRRERDGGPWLKRGGGGERGAVRDERDELERDERDELEKLERDQRDLR